MQEMLSFKIAAVILSAASLLKILAFALAVSMV